MPKEKFPKVLWTIGHSNHSIDEFIQLLIQHQIQLLVDIRRFPGSKTFPHFKQQNLQRSLEKTGIVASNRRRDRHNHIRIQVAEELN